MAARKFSPQHDEQTRLKIKTSQLINRLMKHALGQCEMESTQIRAAEILLKKVLPDLTSTDISKTVTHRHELADCNRDELLAIIHEAGSGQGAAGANGRGNGSGSVH